MSTTTTTTYSKGLAKAVEQFIEGTRQSDGLPVKPRVAIFVGQHMYGHRTYSTVNVARAALNLVIVKLLTEMAGPSPDVNALSWNSRLRSQVVADLIMREVICIRQITRQ